MSGSASNVIGEWGETAPNVTNGARESAVRLPLAVPSCGGSILVDARPKRRRPLSSSQEEPLCEPYRPTT